MSKVNIKFEGIKKLEYNHIPEWNEEEQESVPSFEYNGERIFLDEFRNVNTEVYNLPPVLKKSFDGFKMVSIYDGHLIKVIEDCQSVKLYVCTF